jgi:hypothetical protein
MMVMQQLVSTLARMNEKIDALAVRQQQLPEVLPSRPIEADVRPVARQEETTLPQVETKQETRRVRRSILVELFE